MYSDEGITGLNTKRRSGFNQMLTDALEGKISLIVTKSVSRFARNTVDSLSAIRKLKEAGCEVYFEKEGIHTGAMDGELILSILSGMAADESYSISQNSKWSVQRRFQDGSYEVSYPPYGYTVADGQFTVGESEAEVVRFIFAEVLAGKGTYTIARALNERGIPARRGGRWTAVTVRGMIANESYTGVLLLQKTFTDSGFRRHQNRGAENQYQWSLCNKGLVVAGHGKAVLQGLISDIQNGVQLLISSRRCLLLAYTLSARISSSPYSDFTVFFPYPFRLFPLRSPKLLCFS